MRQPRDIYINKMTAECEDTMSAHRIVIYADFVQPVTYREAEQYITEIMRRGCDSLDKERAEPRRSRG
uniref:Uncharacterized protein n=1 Tax=Siphoviridae sp. ctpbb7 TaxID=2826465 RepID=A0A8S5N0B9_9CAUD|nr:MAG TPA: hypothetical protein [Siphoviridae sp. ctpbb7]